MWRRTADVTLGNVELGGFSAGCYGNFSLFCLGLVVGLCVDVVVAGAGVGFEFEFTEGFFDAGYGGFEFRGAKSSDEGVCGGEVQWG